MRHDVIRLGGVIPVSLDNILFIRDWIGRGRGQYVTWPRPTKANHTHDFDFEYIIASIESLALECDYGRLVVSGELTLTGPYSHIIEELLANDAIQFVPAAWLKDGKLYTLTCIQGILKCGQKYH